MIKNWFANMSDKQKKLLLIATIAVAALVVAAVVLCVVLSGGEKKPVDRNYTVQVKTAAGVPMSDIPVYVYKENQAGDLVWFQNTDAEGKVSFTAKSDVAMVAVLKDVPLGYAVAESYPITGENTVINLSAGTLSLEDVDSLPVYQLGDIMLDFSVTAPDGTQHSLYEMLKEKDAVVLNFWFVNCNFCMEEFPYLQEGYEAYADSIGMLALNPLDEDDEDVTAIADQYGLTFPMALTSDDWGKMLSITGYPTTVVVDRYHTIAMIYRKGFDDAQSFEAVLKYFTADNYTQTLITSLDQIPGIEAEQPGEQGNPTEIGGVESFQVKVAPGQVVNVDLYRYNQVNLIIEDASAYVVNGDETIEAVDGKVQTLISCPDNYTPLTLGFGNSGTEEKTYTVKLESLPGTLNNPYSVEIGDFTVEIEAGNSQGVYYIFKATENGTLTVKCISGTAGVSYDYSLYNLNSYAYRTLAEDAQAGADSGEEVSIAVSAGDEVRISAATLPDSDFNYPAGTFRFALSFESDGTSSGDNTGDNTGGNTGDNTGGNTGDNTGNNTGDNNDGGNVTNGVAYMVTIIDSYGNPIPGATVSFSGTKGQGTATTNDSGKASVKLASGTYTVTVQAPAGYLSPTSSTTLRANSRTGEIVLQRDVPAGYQDLYVGLAYELSEGSQNVSFTSGKLTYFIFTPTRSGLYQFATSSGVISYQGSSTFINESVGTSASCTVNIKDSQVGGDYVFGVKASNTSGTVTVNRVGNAELDISDQPWVVYTGTHTPSTFTFTGNADQLVYVDVSAATSKYQLVLGSDGYYHLNSANGPLLYVNLGSSAPYLSIQDIVSNGTGVRAYVEQEDGSVIKEDYQTLITSYVNCVDPATGLYRLTADLVHILQEYGADQYWSHEEYSFLADSVPNFNPEIAWMFAICYIPQ